MTHFRKFLRTGHAPTLFAAFLYFAFSCCHLGAQWRDGALHQRDLPPEPAQKGLMLSVPIIAGALFRFPLGVLSQYIGRKRATLVEMSLISVAMLFGFFFVHSFDALLAMGVLLGMAGASFGVAMSLGSGSFPRAAQGPGDGHRRRRQRRHRGGRADRAAAGAVARLAGGVRRRRRARC